MPRDDVPFGSDIREAIRAAREDDLHLADARPPEYSDEALALQFTGLHGESLQYVAAWGQWLQWHGGRWQPDDTLRTFDRARAVCRSASALVPPRDKKIATAVASAKTVAAVERLARADRHHAATVSQWDSDPDLIIMTGDD
jgi:putative DNA primase/helicase